MILNMWENSRNQPTSHYLTFAETNIASLDRNCLPKLFSRRQEKTALELKILSLVSIPSGIVEMTPAF